MQKVYPFGVISPLTFYNGMYEIEAKLSVELLISGAKFSNVIVSPDTSYGSFEVFPKEKQKIVNVPEFDFSPGYEKITE